MATVYGVNATKRLNSVPVQNIAASDQGGRVRAAYDKYVSAGAITINTIIKLGKIPAGARVVGYWLKSTDQGTVGAVDLGYSASADGVETADPDAFLASVDVKTAAITLDEGDQENMVGLGRSFSAPVDIIATVTTATDAAGTLEVCVFYTLD